MSNWDLFVTWLILLGLMGVAMCFGVWVCERLDERDYDGEPW